MEIGTLRAIGMYWAVIFIWLRRLRPDGLAFAAAHRPPLQSSRPILLSSKFSRDKVPALNALKKR
jgi:hypothetical protein